MQEPNRTLLVADALCPPFLGQVTPAFDFGVNLKSKIKHVCQTQLIKLAKVWPPAGPPEAWPVVFVARTRIQRRSYSTPSFCHRRSFPVT